MHIFLDSRADNAPITDAVVALTIGDQTIEAKPGEDGTFIVEGGGLEKPGRHEIVASIQAAPGEDLLIGSLDVPAPPQLDAAYPPERSFAGSAPGWARIELVRQPLPEQRRGDGAYLTLLAGLDRCQGRVVRCQEQFGPVQSQLQKLFAG